MSNFLELLKRLESPILPPIERTPAELRRVRRQRQRDAATEAKAATTANVHTK